MDGFRNRKEIRIDLVQADETGSAGGPPSLTDEGRAAARALAA